MREEFRSLAATLLAGREPAKPEDVLEPEIEIAAGPENDELVMAQADLVRDVRLFHARVTEAVEAAVDLVTGDIATEIVARELELAPADIERIVDRALQRYFGESPLRVRVHPDDAHAVQCGVPVIGDALLSRGDAVLELRDGFVDARLGVRVACFLSGAAR